LVLPAGGMSDLSGGESGWAVASQPGLPQSCISPVPAADAGLRRPI